MKPTFVRFGVLTLLATTLMYGCADGTTPVEPSAVPTVAGPSFDQTASSTTVNTLMRTTPLAEDVYASATIFPNKGGEIVIPEAGFKIVFPDGAVSAKTTITVKAHAGSAVAYIFEPHGIVFGKPVRIEQALQNTGAAGRSANLLGGYFKSDSDLNPNGTATVSEIIPTEVEQVGKKIRFYIQHFSGYIVGVG